MKKILIVLVALIAVAFIALFALKDTIVKSVAESLVYRSTGFQLTMESLEVSPFAQSLTIKGARLLNPSGFEEKEALEINELSIAVSLASIFSSRLHVREATVDIARITIVQKPDGSSNVDLLTERLESSSSDEKTPAEKPAEEHAKTEKTTPQPPKPEKSAKPFLINLLTLRMGEADYIQYTDDQPTPKKQTIVINKERTYKNITSIEQLTKDIFADVVLDQGVRALNDWAKENSDKLGVKKEEIDQATQVIGGFLNSLKSK
ncbi:MAG: hypothetical protein PHP44_13680 [Kiritimatiellae bacterium]|nr:hypothetical protein [Kiritimatiellia bacterium]